MLLRMKFVRTDTNRCKIWQVGSGRLHPPAQCTCATEALANGIGSTDRNTSSMGRPSSRCTVFLMTCHGTGSVLSRHFSNSRTYSSGKSVGELAMNCPTKHRTSSEHLLGPRISAFTWFTVVWSLHRKPEGLKEQEHSIPSLMYVAPSFSKSFLRITWRSNTHCLHGSGQATFMHMHELDISCTGLHAKLRGIRQTWGGS